QIGKLEALVKGMGARGLAWARIEAGGGWGQSPLAKAISDGLRLELNGALEAREGDVILLQFGKPAQVHTVMANLRLHLGRKFGLIPEVGSGGTWDFFWVVDPPMFEYDEAEKKWVAAHHAFTMPREEDMEFLESDPGRVRCYRYDLVLNGYEIAGGSIRAHRPDIQARIFKALGISDEDAREKFGFLLEAFRYGAPPHGGIAVGWDRLIWLLTEAGSMREVYAFPKTQNGSDLMTGAPTPIDERLLRDLNIRVIE
ncbi:MAG: aspartate--tRNA ligase, partial [Planctomycetota bacterium]|nr:aspartate--tRNA ligase [Planctomycetota bacterium]